MQFGHANEGDGQSQLIDGAACARDDLLGSEVTTHRVQGDGKASTQLTSTATRPLYQPQFGQTTWGNLEVAHWGQTLRAGRSRRQFAARRLRVLALLVLRLGTAIDLLFHQNGRTRLASLDPSVGVRKLESVQCSPPRIERRLAVTGRLVEVDAAVGAQPLAVAATERRQRQVQAGSRRAPGGPDPRSHARSR